jgi:penicillin-binding protein 1A
MKKKVSGKAAAARRRPRAVRTLALGAVLLGAGGTAILGVGAAAVPCPSIDAFRAYRPPEASRIFAMDGSRVADLSPERRTVISLDRVPAAVRDGFIAVEDRRFHEHQGIDLRGVARALWRNVSAAGIEEGFSTITMQLTRNVFSDELPRSSRVRRKICEVRLAGRIETEFAKDAILQQYVNQVYMGSGLYGVEAAAQAYFGKPAAELDHAEAALLVGLVKNPEGYNPRRNPERAVVRRNTVLGVMAREGVITQAEAQQASAAPLELATPPEAAGPAPWFVAAVRRELTERFGPDADTRGLRVHTGLDPRIQRAAQAALRERIRRIEAGEFGRYRHPVPGEGPLTPANGSGSPYLQGMVLVLDTRTGEVRAMVGGRDFTHSSYDRVFQARRQPGSAFKPFVFAAALEAGLPAGEVVETTPVSLTSTGSPVWRPDDLVSDTVTSLSLRRALAMSSNHAAIRVGQFAGVGHVIDVAHRLGISSEIPAVPSVFLGAAEVIPAEFVAAFGAIANGGTRIRPTLISRVEDANGTVLWEAVPSGERALRPAIAFLTVDMMRDVVDAGTGASVRRAGFALPAAGKTGTTNESKDVWFVGMTPELVGGVWLGFDRPASIMPNASGGLMAAPIWAEVMNAAYEGRPSPGGWAAPDGVVSVAIDVHSGHKATGNCPEESVRDQFFLAGTAPTEYCPLHPEGGAERFLKRLFGGLRRIF